MSVGDVATWVTAAIAVGALVVAYTARRDAERSADAAESSATSAQDSAHAAQESLKLQRSDHERSRERVDVEWVRVKPEEERGVVVFRNDGSTRALGVQVRLTINGEPVSIDAGDVEPDGLITYDASAEYGRRALGADAERRSAETSGLILSGAPRFAVKARITWQSEHGTPGVKVL